MTNQEWLDKAKSNQDILKQFLNTWQPTIIARKPGMRITAPNVEAASHIVRAQIRRNNAERADPSTRFDTALEHSKTNQQGAVDVINAVLNEAWFGVPESTDCWKIPGFREAVELMEDLPEESEE